jgi:hypothetical protein
VILKWKLWDLDFYSKSEAYTISLCPDSLCPDGIRRTWDRTDMGLDGHGIPSRIAVTFRMIPPGNERTFRGIPSGNERTGDWTDMGSFLGSPWPSVWFLLGTNGHGIERTWDPFWDRTDLSYPLISEAWLSGLALSHVLRLTLVGCTKKYHRTVQKYVCTVQYLDGLRQFHQLWDKFMSHFVAATNTALSTVLVGRANGSCYCLLG